MNSPERMQQIQQLFHASLERKAEERRPFLQQACADDLELQSEVEALLAAHSESSDTFLQPPPPHTSGALPTEPLTQILPPPPAPRTISHYEVISLLGKGGMGEVYLASDKLLGRKAALKILPARFTTNTDLVHRFEREAKAASALNHPNILTVYEIGQTDDSHFIATEFIAGETLRQRLKRAPLLLTEALDIAVQIAAALQAAHEAGIIHRDIKPENIMLRPDGYVKVLDFGLAKLTELRSADFGMQNADADPQSPNHIPQSTVSGVILGTPSYMSPEQARGQKVDHRTDIWSFGIVLHELVSGARPFTGDTQADLMVAILQHQPTPLPSHLPEQLQTIISRALMKEPQQRYAAMHDLIEDLKALRRKVEFASELKHAGHAEEAVTLPLAPALNTQPELPASKTVATIEVARFPARAMFAGLALLSAIGIASWFLLKPQPVITPPPVVTTAAPKHEVTWWLDVQRMQGNKLEDKSYQSAGRDWFPNGSKFRFNLTSPQSGYLYLLNEGPTTGGKISLNLLFPTPANNNLNAAVAANQPIQTGNFQFDTNQGEEKFWIVWATNPIAEIEAVKTTAKPTIHDASQSAAILQLLNKHAGQTAAQADEAKELTHVTGDVVLAQMVRLKHR
jgi:serine/threonine protein kinase